MFGRVKGKRTATAIEDLVRATEGQSEQQAVERERKCVSRRQTKAAQTNYKLSKRQKQQLNLQVTSM